MKGSNTKDSHVLSVLRQASLYMPGLYVFLYHYKLWPESMLDSWYYIDSNINLGWNIDRNIVVDTNIRNHDIDKNILIEIEIPISI